MLGRRRWGWSTVATGLVALVGGAGLVGCSGSSDGAPPTTTTTTTTSTVPVETTPASLVPGTYGEQEYVDAMAVGLGTVFAAAAGGPGTDEAARCVAVEWVRTIGVGQFEAAGLVPEAIETFEIDALDLDLTELDARVMARAITNCGIDLAEIVAELVASTLDPTAQGCVADLLRADVALAEDLVTALFSGGAEDPATLAGLVRITEPCGVDLTPPTVPEEGADVSAPDLTVTTPP